MTKERIEQIRESTLFPKSVSVQRALLQVWNECLRELTAEREKAAKLVNSLEMALQILEENQKERHPFSIRMIRQSLTEYKKQ